MSLVFIALLASAKDPSPLEKARTLYAEVQYGEAIALLDSVLSRPDLSKQDREAATLLIGFCQTGLGNAAAAKKRFVEVLDTNPDAKLPPGTSPKIREAFEIVRKEIKAKVKIARAEPFLRPAASGPGYTARFTIERTGESAVALFSRKKGAQSYQKDALTQEADGQWSVRLTSEDTTLQFYIDVQGKEGFGSATQPEEVFLPARSSAKPAQAPVAAVVEGPPLYTRWWLWTIVGVVVVGVAAGVTTGVILADRAAARPGSLNVNLEVGR